MPATVVRCDPQTIAGNPEGITTSHIERFNLTTRMAGLTNAFSKRLENLKAAVALNFAYYIFLRIH